MPRQIHESVRPISLIKTIIKDIDDRKWNKVKARLTLYPSDASHRFGIKSINGDMTLCYPLHMACMRQPPKSIVLTMLDVYQSANNKKDSMHGRLPVHYACRFGASLEVIMLLFSMNPGSIKERENDGSLPLHLACKQVTTSKEVLYYLIRNYPAGLEMKNNAGNTPLDIAASDQAKITVRTLALLEQGFSVGENHDKMKKDFLERQTSEDYSCDSTVDISEKKGSQTFIENKMRKIRSETKKCVVCMEKDASHVMIPCGHVCLCRHCARPKALKLMKFNCPECRGRIQATQRIWGKIANEN